MAFDSSGGFQSYPHVEFVSKKEDHSFVHEWYDLNSENHFWFQWRFEALKRQIRDLNIPAEKTLKILDIGCGTGITRDQLESETKWSVDLCDLSLDCLAKLQPKRGSIFYYNILERKASFQETYDMVLLFDILEHIEDTHTFLAAALWHLKPKGYLMVNVPAMPALLSRYDEAAGHLRRYDRYHLALECQSLPVDIRDIRYWGMSLIPLLCLRKIMLQKYRETSKTIKLGFAQPGEFVHLILKMMMRIETAFFSSLPLGTSLLLAAQKKDCR